MLINITFSEPFSKIASKLHLDPSGYEKTPLKFGQLHNYCTESFENSCKLSILAEAEPFLLLDYQNQVPGIKQAKKKYLNDRPYVASSLLSLALGSTYRATIAGLIKDSELLDVKLEIPVLRCDAGTELLTKLFEPLGYQVSTKSTLWDDAYPDMGESYYFHVTLTGKQTSTDLFRHLYGMLAFIDNEKQDWLSAEERDTFKTSILEWFRQHPEIEFMEQAFDDIANKQQDQLPKSVLSGNEKQSLPDVPETIDEAAYLTLRSELESARVRMHTVLKTLDSVHLGNEMVTTRLMGNVPIKSKDMISALHLVNYLDANPKCLVYSPPTMSFPQNSKRPDCLEHPEDIFQYFASHNIEQVICEEKHMGARLSIIICKDPATAKEKFGVRNGSSHLRFNRLSYVTRQFDQGSPFADPLEIELMDHVKSCLDSTNFWDEFETNWVYLDCELLPWSRSNVPLKPVRHSNWAIGTAGVPFIDAALEVLMQAKMQGHAVDELLQAYNTQRVNAEKYRQQMRQYSWPVNSVSDLKLAPFHILATEGQTHFDKTHTWHLDQINRIVDADEKSMLLHTGQCVVNLKDPESVASAISWWDDLIQSGGEGVVIKPMNYVEQVNDALVQPAIKCRGKDFLQLVYGPEYAEGENLDKVKARGIGTKERLAFYEFSLGIEALERFVRGESTEAVYECFLAALALECGYKQHKPMQS